MSNKLVIMQQIRLIIHHLQRHQSGRRIAKELELSRNTVTQLIFYLNLNVPE